MHAQVREPGNRMQHILKAGSVFCFLKEGSDHIQLIPKGQKFGFSLFLPAALSLMTILVRFSVFGSLHGQRMAAV